MSDTTYSPVMVVGDTLTMDIQWVDSENNPISFNGRNVRFVVRDSELNTGSTLVDIDTTNNMDIIYRPGVDTPLFDGSTGTLAIRVPSATTALFPVGTLPYQVQVTDTDNGDVRTILRGYIKTTADLAR